MVALREEVSTPSTENVFILRLFLQDGKYQLVKTPIDVEESKRAQPCLGKSEKGVYFATVSDKHQFRLLS